MNIEPVRIFGKDDIDTYRNENAPNNNAINLNPLVSFSSSSSLRGEEKKERETQPIQNDDEIALPEFEDTIDNCENPSSLRDEGEEEEESEDEIKPSRGNVFGSKPDGQEKKPFSRSSLIYIAMGISLLKFL